jgi:hypothetical protein
MDSIRIEAIDHIIENLEFLSTVFPGRSLVQGVSRQQYQG